MLAKNIIKAAKESGCRKHMLGLLEICLFHFCGGQWQKKKKKQFDICRVSEIIMDYGLQELREQMKIAITSGIPSYTFTNAEDRT